MEASQLSPATITLNSFTADNSGVSDTSTTYTIVFSPQVAMDPDSIIEIILPERLTDLDNCDAISDQLNLNAEHCDRELVRWDQPFFAVTAFGL